MPSTTQVAVTSRPAPRHGYEFCGPPGALALSTLLPAICYALTFLCNDVSGCPATALLSPLTLTLEKLKRDIAWPRNGIRGLLSVDATLKVLAYYLLSLVLHRVLPGERTKGVKLASGGRLDYKFNTWSSAMVTFAMLAAGTAWQGAEFPVWTYIYDHLIQILTANILIAYALATYAYITSFSVKAGNKEHRELALGGQSGNMLYDWFIGRELNPRVTLPLLGEVDIKAFCELRPGLMGSIILDLVYIAHQYRMYGHITDSIVLITAFQSLYVLDSFWMEPAILTTMDITTDGFGFMLAFGDLVWVPFTYSMQARYLAVYPLSLGPAGTLGVLALAGVGYYIFRAANNEKNIFRTNPHDARVAHLKYITTKSGSKLLTSGWWGTARHINYTGDWILAWAYCLTTGMAGYVVQHGSVAPRPAGQSAADGSYVYRGAPETTEVVQGQARGWGTIFTYFYLVYFAVLLVHRELRDEEKCAKKYGADWARYKEIVRWRLIPGIY